VEQILGYKPEDLVGTKAFDYVHPEDLGFASVSLAKTLENPGMLPPIEFRVRAADRSWRYVEMILNNKLDDPNVRGVIANTRDFTERVLAEEKLRESEEKFKAQYKSIPIPTYSWRTLDGDFVLIEYNDAAYEITKGHIADLLGVRATELYPDKPDVLEMFSRCFEERLTPLPWIS
jgi:PAS domain S-box-containing protein